MTNGRDRRRRRGARNGRLQALVVVLAVGTGLVAGLTTPTRRVAGPVVPAVRDLDESGPAEVTPARLSAIVHTDPDGSADLVVVAGVGEDGRAGTVVLVPSRTLVEVPSLGSQTLADASRLGDEALLGTTLENSLGLAFDDVLVLDDAALVALLTPAGSFSADLRRAVRVEDDAGVLTVRAGVQELDPAAAMRLLTAPGEAGELEHLVTVQAVLDGWRRALADPETAANTRGVDPRSIALGALADADLRWSTLPVDQVATGGDERFAVRRDAVRDLVHRAFPWAVLGDGDRPRVEILNGTGAVGATRRVAEVVVPAGGEVTLTGNVRGFGQSETRVVYYRDSDADAARAMLDALGVGSVAKADQALQVVDLTIVIGSDYSASTSRGAS